MRRARSCATRAGSRRSGWRCAASDEGGPMDWLGRWSEPLLRGALAGLLGGAGAGAWAGGPIDATPVVDYLDHFQGRDGSGPRGGLILATDGNYYGTTFAGGS